ncbi:GIY-YIG nuclease family protein, partial [Mesorhizobium sp.]
MTASQKRGTIYIGVTNDLGRRMPEHKSGEGSRFTSRYGVQRLVWY